jgi:hypothetical protein
MPNSPIHDLVHQRCRGHDILRKREHKALGAHLPGNAVIFPEKHKREKGCLPGKTAFGILLIGNRVTA